MSYKDNLAIKIATSSNFELVSLLYQALIEETTDLKKNILSKDKEKITQTSDKIREIISHLIATLGEENTEFKNQSLEMYLQINKKITKSVIVGNADLLDGVINIFCDLRDAWKETSNKNIEVEKNLNISNAITYGKKDVNITGSMKDFGKI